MLYNISAIVLMLNFDHKKNFKFLKARYIQLFIAKEITSIPENTFTFTAQKVIKNELRSSLLKENTLEFTFNFFDDFLSRLL